MIDLLVVGSGIIGSWVALVAARRGLVTAVCDQSADPRDGITGRNSGVLHAGLYYEPDSRKARHCIRGRTLAVEFARDRNVPFEICGKLIVTGRHAEPDRNQEAETRLLALRDNAVACGATGLELIRDPGGTYPHVLGALALHSKNSGVIDVPAYHAAVRLAAEEAGAIFLLGRECRALQSGRAELLSIREQEGGVEAIECSAIVNAAGLQADVVAGLAGLRGYEVRPNRGEYYRLRRSLPYRKLVYPLPAASSTALGVHYTFHMNGDAYAGPNSVWADHKADYRITMERRVFFESLEQILDSYTEEDLEPGYSGLRPRLFLEGAPVREFVIEEQPARVLHLLGIESPGLTASPALAEEVVERLFPGG
ncbi:MAG: FAD-dependent oxidoreductase [Spirochaetales bacterium]|nr:FAD-dependent oxidoreductase [Spirochaetales bacterium]MCP5484704.1 FAD-dependent oxidoreductase [Spirochaetales bacterium]